MKKIFILIVMVIASLTLTGCDTVAELFRTEYISKNTVATKASKSTTSKKESTSKKTSTTVATYSISTTEDSTYEKKSRSTTTTFIPKTTYITNSKEKMEYTTQASTCEHNEVELDQYVYPQFMFYGYNGGTYCNKCGNILSLDFIEPYGTTLFSKYIYLVNEDDVQKEVEYSLVIDSTDATSSIYDSQGHIIDDVKCKFILVILTRTDEDGYVVSYEKGNLKWVNDGVYAVSYDDKTKPSDFMMFQQGEFMFTDMNGSASKYTHIARTKQARTYIPRSGNTDYGYYFLSNYENSVDLQALYYDYYKYAEGLYNCTEDVPKINGQSAISYINTDAYDLSYDEICGVWNLFCNCSPAYYFLSNQIITINRTTPCFLINEYYSLNANRLNYMEKLEEFETAFETYKTTYEVENTEKDIVKAIHDYICTKVEYAWIDKDARIPESAIWAHGMTGSILYGEGVCECYSKTFLYLCVKNEIDALIVCGKAEDEGHSWNVVCVNGNWYGVDVTWDDGGKTIAYNYLCVNNDTINENRVIDGYLTISLSFQYMIPELSSESLIW